jgi:hypothetical protein
MEFSDRKSQYSVSSTNALSKAESQKSKKKDKSVKSKKQ